MPESDISPSKSKLYYFAVAIAGVAIFSFILILGLFYTLLPVDLIKNRQNYIIDTNAIDHLGSAIGGIVGSILTISSLLFVLLSLKQQREDFKKQEIENRFFLLLHLFDENIKNYSYKNFQGFGLFHQLINSYFEIFRLVQIKIDYHYLSDKNKNEHKKSFLYNHLIFEITYMLLLFGREKSVKHANIEKLKSFFPDTYFKPGEISQYSSVYTNIMGDTAFDDYIENKSFILDQYFQMLYSIITYINGSSSDLMGNKKKEFVEILLTKISKDQQLLLFLFSITSFGCHFEQSSCNDGFNQLEVTKTDINQCLITKYHLIRNIKDSHFLSVHKIEPQAYYPKVKFTLDHHLRNI